MVNPGAFSGTRKEFLTAQKALYAEAVTENHVADTVSDIQRRFFKRYPISLPHTEEPSAEWLEQVDDNGPDPDLLPPDETLLDKEAFKASQLVYDNQVKLLKFRKEQITRRLAYQHSKEHAPTKHIAIGSEDPMVALMMKLAGIPMKKPRIRTAYNVWGQHNREFADAIYEARVKAGNVPMTKRAALRMQVYKESFDKLDSKEKKDYERMAVDEHRIAVEKIELALNEPPSQSPADRQQVLKGLPSFVQPILDLISDYTGWKATLMVGGPEPANQGRLNMMSFHSGETTGNIKMNFGRSERRGYKNFVMPIFGTFLKKCYTVEDCRAAALSDSTTTSLAEVLQSDGHNSFSVESVEGAISYVKVARTQSENRELNEANLPSQIPSTPMALPQAIKQMHSQTENAAATVGNSPVPSPAPSPCASPMPQSRALSPEMMLAHPVSQSFIPQHSFIPPVPPFVIPSTPSSLISETPTPTISPTPLSLISAAPASTGSQKSKHPYLNGDSDGESAAKVDTPLRKRLRSSKGAGVLSPDADAAGVAESQAAISSAGGPAHAVPAITRTPIPPMTPADLTGCPDWFLKVYQMLLSNDLGPSWRELIRLWAHFEKESRYEEQEKLGTAGRPSCIGAWISRARAATYRPDLGALPLFEKSFVAWWASLQPGWRREGSNGALKRQPGDLEGLRRPGKNGLVSVLAALFFWGVYAEKKGRASWQLRWQEAADDVHWVIQGLNISE